MRIELLIPWEFFPWLLSIVGLITYLLYKLSSIQSETYIRCHRAGWNQCCLEAGHANSCLLPRTNERLRLAELSL